jgi:hypothetical protein
MLDIVSVSPAVVILVVGICPCSPPLVFTPGDLLFPLLLGSPPLLTLFRQPIRSPTGTFGRIVAHFPAVETFIVSFMLLIFDLVSRSGFPGQIQLHRFGVGWSGLIVWSLHIWVVVELRFISCSKGAKVKRLVVQGYSFVRKVCHIIGVTIE